MTRAISAIGCLLLASLVLDPAAAAKKTQPAWDAVRKEARASLSVDRGSVLRDGDSVRFRYLVDYARLQGDPKVGYFYRSLVVHAAIHCKARTIALGRTEAYLGHRAKGTYVGTSTPTQAQAAFAPIEAGTSDEDLWKHLCGARKPRKGR